MQIVVDKVSGEVVWRTGFCYELNGAPFWPTPELAIKDAMANVPGLVEAHLITWETQDKATAEALQGCEPSKLVATIESEVVTSVSPEPAPPALYVHVDITGFTEGASGTNYLRNNGADQLTVHAELWTGPAKEAPYEQVTHYPDESPITGLWALELVNVETGVLADSPLVQMTAGVIDYNYTTTIAPCQVRLDESRFEEIGGFKLRLVEDIYFKIVR